jgi:hypothetical protein
MLAAAEASDAAASTANNKEEKPPLISVATAAAAPPESLEARLALRQHREASAFNRFTFRGNVLEGTGDVVDHWIVIFCPGWHDKCQGLLPSYELLGVQWENKQNKAVMGSSVRFVKVDCATEKALCVSLDIHDYPSVVHYRNQQRVASWHGGAPGLVRFVKQELEGGKRHDTRKKRRTPKSMPTCTLDSSDLANIPSEEDHHWFSLWLRLTHLADACWRPWCFAFMFLTAAHCSWMCLSTNVRRQQSVSKPVASHLTSVQDCLPQEWLQQGNCIEL